MSQSNGYRVTVKKSAAKELAKIDARFRGNIERAIRALGSDPRPSGVTKLTGRDGYRIRVGDYRVVYVIDDVVRIVNVVKVGHRREVYLP